MKRIMLSIAISALFFTASPISTGKKTNNSTNNWNFIVNIAANNNLYRYGLKNMEQMQAIGSNKHINLFVQIDNFGKREVSYYHIEKGKATLLETIKTNPEGISGTPENLFAFAKYVITKHPAKYQAIVLWDHGAGIKDLQLWSRLYSRYRDECFKYNPETEQYEIQRDVLRGISFNDISHTYLTNEDLKATLLRIKNELLNGKKIDLLGMDACHMAMAEICTQVRDTADYFVGSEEIEPGPGWDYSVLLKEFQTRTLLPKEFSEQIVQAYNVKYQNFADHTQSAIDLAKYVPLEKNIDTVSSILTKIVLDADKNDIFKIIYDMRLSSRATKAFLDDDYIDLPHFYKNSLANLRTYKTNDVEKQKLVDLLRINLEEGLRLINACIIKNTTGRNARNAHGLAIYFPRKKMHASYPKTDFAINTNWCHFVYSFLQRRHRDIKERIRATLDHTRTQTAAAST